MGCGSSSPATPPTAKPLGPVLLRERDGPAGKGRGQGAGAKQGKGKGKGKGHFQVELASRFQDYQGEEDRVLKRAYMSGLPNARYRLRGQSYTYDFGAMQQLNADSGKARRIRPPRGLKAPAKPIVPPGPTMVVRVPAGAPGKKMQVPNPRAKGSTITVIVPKHARAGQEMLVPIPDADAAPARAKAGWSTGAKVAAGAVAAAAVAGAVIALDPEWAEPATDWAAAAAEDAGEWAEGAAEDAAEWAEPAVDWAAGAAEDAGEWAAGAAEDAAEWFEGAGEDVGAWVVDAGEEVGSFFMDLF